MASTTWIPKPSDYLAALQDQNPWEKLGRVPQELAKPMRRPLAAMLWRTMHGPLRRYQVVLGPRRVGKTVAMYQTIDQLIKNGVSSNRLWFLRLDHPLLMHYHLGGWAKSLIRTYHGTADSPLFLFLDEVNYSESWDKWLKTFYDENWPLRIMATSSSTAALRNRTMESGIGRWSEQFLTPYTFTEFLGLRGDPIEASESSRDFLETLRSTIERREDLSRTTNLLRLFLLVGGFPELLGALVEDDVERGLLRSQQVLRSEAVQRVAGMDIPQVFDIKHPLMLERLLYILAGQMCGLMNVSALAADLQLNRQTIHTYVDYLQQAFLIFALPNYSTSEESIQRKGRKVYFVDGAVRNAALQRGLAPMHDAHEWGFLIENTVASHLYGLSLQSGGRLFHWRDGNDEVDFIYSASDNPVAFEVAKRTHGLDGLRALQSRYPRLRNRCFLISGELQEFRLPEDDPDGVGRVPLASFLAAVGQQTMTALTTRLGVSDAT